MLFMENRRPLIIPEGIINYIIILFVLNALQSGKTTAYKNYFYQYPSR